MIHNFKEIHQLQENLIIREDERRRAIMSLHRHRILLLVFCSAFFSSTPSVTGAPLLSRCARRQRHQTQKERCGVVLTPSDEDEEDPIPAGRLHWWDCPRRSSRDRGEGPVHLQFLMDARGWRVAAYEWRGLFYGGWRPVTEARDRALCWGDREIEKHISYRRPSLAEDERWREGQLARWRERLLRRGQQEAQQRSSISSAVKQMGDSQFAKDERQSVFASHPADEAGGPETSHPAGEADQELRRRRGV